MSDNVSNPEQTKIHWCSVNSNNKKGATKNQKNLDDDPCWGTPTQCSLSHLLQLIRKSEAILYESDDFLVLNKSPDLRMDGSYAATVHKLLTYWYPSPSLVGSMTEEIDNAKTDDDRKSLSLLQKIDDLNEFSDTPDNELRPCHRLDYATSGVLLVARNRAAAQHAKHAFEHRQVGKRYTALWSGHVVQPSDTNPETAACWPVLTRAELNTTFSEMELRYRQLRKKRRQDTFQGFMPPRAMLDRWRASILNGGDAATSGTNRSNKKRKKNPVPELTAAEWDSVWQNVSSLSEEQRQRLLDSTAAPTWKDLQRLDDQATMSLFEQAADRYNELVRGKLDAMDQPTELPTFFRVREDDDDDNNSTHDESGTYHKHCFTFYISAPLAQVDDDFAMRILPNYQHWNTTLKVGDPTTLDFKPSLTRCTVRQCTYLRSNDKPNSRMPVTLVDLEPRSGRRHQLRVHAALAGHAIVGDCTYFSPNHHSATTNTATSWIQPQQHPRLCLHSAWLKLALLRDNSHSRPNNNNNNYNVDRPGVDEFLEVTAASPFQYQPEENAVKVHIISHPTDATTTSTSTIQRDEKGTASKAVFNAV